MIIGGLQKSSLIDYPGKVSCVLFVSGCNFHCPYCHNPGLVKRGILPCPTLLNEKTACDFLQKRRGFLDGVVISGGEPTLHKRLTSLCEKIKKMGYPVKLDTNGSRPRVIRQLISEDLVDYIAMDIKTDPFSYAPLITKKYDPDWILSSIQIIMKSCLAYEFRTTCVKPIVDEHSIEKIAKIIEGAKLYALQRFYNTEVLNPEFFRETGSGYDEHDVLFLKSAVEPWVKKCIVR